METRQQKLEANAKHMEEVQKRFPGTDMTAMSEGMQRNIHFEYDVKVLFPTCPCLMILDFVPEI